MEIASVYLATLLCCVAVAAASVLLWPAVELSRPTVPSHLMPAHLAIEPVARSTIQRQSRTVGSLFLRQMGWGLARLFRQSQERQALPIYPGSSLTVVELYGLKLVAMVVSALAFVIVAREFVAVNPLFVVVAAGVGWWLPSLWRRARLRRRHRAILRLLPEIIDLLALCVGAGLDFLGAMNRVVTAKAGVHQPLVDELSTVLQEIRLGKRRVDALKALAARVQLAEMGSFVRTLVQADRMGTPMGEALVIHSEDVRAMRFVKAEREALKAPIKLLFPLVLIMFSVLILVAAPILLQFVRQSPLQGFGP